MKKQLLLIFLIVFSFSSFSQAPEIDGDLLLCPWEDGTASITSAQTYDTYQWYYKYWFLPDDYEAIDGATGASFTYDWYTYDQALLKVEVTLDGVTYESNAIQIDSWAWASLFMFYDLGENATFDPITESVVLCQGASFEVGINNPPYDTNIVWYRNGFPIDDANSSSFLISGPGYYEVSAAPNFCPNNSSNSLGINVVMDAECSLSVNDPVAETVIKIYPNPVKSEFSLVTKSNVFEAYSIVDLTGKIVASGIISQAQSVISIASLSNGIYILHLTGENQTSAHKIVKE